MDKKEKKLMIFIIQYLMETNIIDTNVGSRAICKILAK